MREPVITSERHWLRVVLLGLVFSVASARSAEWQPDADASLEEEVRWLVEENVVVDIFDDESNATQNRIQAKMAADPDLYYPIFLRRATSGDFSRSTISVFGYLAFFVDSRRVEIVELCESVLSGRMRGDIRENLSTILKMALD